MRIAVLGMGKMGHAVAGRLLEGGHEVTVWNRSPGKAGDLAGEGATDRSGQPASGAVDGAEVVITSLSDDAAVRAVVIDGGVAGRSPPSSPRCPADGSSSARTRARRWSSSCCPMPCC